MVGAIRLWRQRFAITEGGRYLYETLRERHRQIPDVAMAVRGILCWELCWLIIRKLGKWETQF